MVESRPGQKANPKNESQLVVRRTRLMGQINSSSVGDVMRDIDSANDNDDVQVIKMVLGSGGGSIYDGIALHDHIKASEKPVDIIAAGLCMSAAVTVMQAGRRRLSYPNTSFMVHPATYSTGPKNLDEVQLSVEQYEKLNETFLKLTSERAGMTKEDMESIYKPIKYLTANEARNIGTNGLIDDIVVFRK